VMGLSFMFKLDQSSIPRHLGEREKEVSDSDSKLIQDQFSVIEESLPSQEPAQENRRKFERTKLKNNKKKVNIKKKDNKKKDNKKNSKTNSNNS